jgi:hypothetical protein
MKKYENNTMYNKTKKIQTMLFASLIAAMILPFSGIQFADAEKVSYDQALERLDQFEAEISTKDSISEEDAKALKRTGTVERIHHLRQI